MTTQMRRVLTSRQVALRSHDITQGLQMVDATSAAVAELSATRITGWAAALSSNLREQEIEDLRALKAVAAQTLGIEAFAFNDVVGVLEETEVASVQERRGGKKILYVQGLPLSTIYERLGQQFRKLEPTEIDEAMLSLIDALGTAPRREGSLRREMGLDEDTQQLVLNVSGRATLVKSINTEDGDRILYTPFYAFENADALAELMTGRSEEDVAAEFDAVRGRQGLAVSAGRPILQAAVAAGLIAAPTISGVSGPHSFAILPYSVSPEIRTVKKVVLEKAQAIVATIRYGQGFAKATKVKWPEFVLRKLVDAACNYQLNPHSEHGSQYFVLAQLRIVELVRSGDWYAVRLIPTEDNIEAVKIAIDLIKHGELVDQRFRERDDIRALIESSRDYKHPLWAVGQQRPRVPLSEGLVRRMLESIQGGNPVV